MGKENLVSCRFSHGFPISPDDSQEIFEHIRGARNEAATFQALLAIFSELEFLLRPTFRGINIEDNGGTYTYIINIIYIFVYIYRYYRYRCVCVCGYSIYA